MTETPTPSAVTRAALAALVVGLGLVVVAALVSGSSAAYGALVGAAIAVGVYGLGAFAVDAVARLAPATSLLFALLTYTFQVALMALVFVMLSGSGLLDGTLDGAWLGGAIIVATFAWMAVQIRLATTQRIPAFERVEGGAR